jgi:hypothetical protein
VLFGGQGPNNTPLYDDTWTWDGTTWTQQTAATKPTGRSLPGMVYDLARTQFALFGGVSGTSFVNDTWVLSVGSPANGGTAFAFQGQPQTWIVPPGVTSVSVDARGAQGGGNPSAATPEGGKGGRVQTTLSVTPGETLTIFVGGRGGDLTGPNNAGPGGFNGGGTGGTDNVDFNGPAGGGGGASDVRQGGNDVAHRVVVAGGGGGAECCTLDSGGLGGAGGGLTGMPGGSKPFTAAPGGGGTQFSGGAGGSGCNGSGTAGSFGQGGVGGNGNRAGGGGGGGYYGGGGGGGCTYGAGGGGGSSYSIDSNAVHTQGYQTGDGQVIITIPSSAVLAPTITSTNPSQAVQGGHLSLFLINGSNFQTSAAVSFSGGQDIAITAMYTSPTQIVLNLSVSATSAPGTHSVTMTNPDGQSATFATALSVLTVFPPPQTLSAVVGNQIVHLQWSSAQSAPLGYNVYVNGVRANSSGLLGHTGFGLTGLQNGQVYKFDVTAVGSGGESSPATIFAEPNAFVAPPHPLHPILFLHGINADATAWETTADFLTGTLGWTCGGTFAYASTDDPKTQLPQIASIFKTPSPCLSGLGLPADYFTANFGDNLANYSDSTGIFHQGDEVGGFIRMLQGRGPLSVVAWSMGGLAVRSYMQVSDPLNAPKQISDLITLGTPHWGVNGNDPLVIDAAGILGFATSRGFFDMNGGCAASGVYGATQDLSQFLQSLDFQPAFPLPASVRYVVVSGLGGPPFYNVDCNQPFAKISTDWAVPSTSSTLTGILPASKEWSRLDTPDVHTEPLLGTALPDDFSSILCALDQNCLEFQVMSPVDIQVTSPTGLTISNNFTSMPGADYTAVVDASGHETATILIPFPHGGAYTIAVTPKPGAQPTDTYTITMTQDGATTTIADHVQVQNIPSDSYHPHVNSRPFANAGADQTVEATGPSGTAVALNGSASGDQDGDALTYKWTDSLGNMVGSSAIVTVVAQLGTQTYTLTVTDPFGLSAMAQTHVTIRDTRSPMINCGAPDVFWHASDVSIPCTAGDAGSGLASPQDASFFLNTSVPAGTETSNAPTGTRSVCDVARNCASAGPIVGNMVDKKPPVINIATPVNSATYTANQKVSAAYGCTDLGSGVASCMGTVPTGASIDTSPNGTSTTKTFIVKATDAVNNASSQSLSYTVSCHYVALGITPSSVARGGKTIVTGTVMSCMPAAQTISEKFTLTGPLGPSCSKISTVMFTTPQFTLAAGTSKTVSFPFIVPKNACAGTYTTTATTLSGGTAIDSASATLTVQ